MKSEYRYLADLARNLRVLTDSQALRAYFDNNLGKMRRTLQKHADEGYITLSTELVRPRLSQTPLALIGPRDQLPCSHQLAYAAAKRWSELLYPTLTIRGTLKLSAVYGGEIRPVVAGHLSHEVALADIFLFSKRADDPQFEWTLIQAAPGAGAMPDAVSADGAIEVIGRYNGATVSAKLAMSGRCKLELW